MTETGGGADSTRRNWSDMLPRLASAAVLIPVVAVAIFFGGWLIALAVAVTIAGAFREWDTIINGGHRDWRTVSLMALLAASPFAFEAFGSLAALAVTAVAVAVAIVAADSNRAYLFRAPGVALLGIAGIAWMALRGDTADGIWAAVFLAAVIWLTDSGALVVGRLIGGFRLSPEISPSKTWSGAIGGLIIGTIGGLVVWLLASDSPWWIGVIIASSLSILAQLGDLAESALKRWFMVKDSGDIIPGHGGILDRIDSFTVGGIGLYILGALHAGTGAAALGVLVW